MQLPQFRPLGKERVRDLQTPLFPQPPERPISFRRNRRSNLDPTRPMTCQSLCFHHSAIALGRGVNHKEGVSHLMQQGVQKLLYKPTGPELFGQAFDLYMDLWWA